MDICEHLSTLLFFFITHEHQPHPEIYLSPTNAPNILQQKVRRPRIATTSESAVNRQSSNQATMSWSSRSRSSYGSRSAWRASPSSVYVEETSPAGWQREPTPTDPNFDPPSRHESPAEDHLSRPYPRWRDYHLLKVTGQLRRQTGENSYAQFTRRPEGTPRDPLKTLRFLDGLRYNQLPRGPFRKWTRDDMRIHRDNLMNPDLTDLSEHPRGESFDIWNSDTDPRGEVDESTLRWQWWFLTHEFAPDPLDGPWLGPW